VVENRNDVLLVRAESLQWAQEISPRMVDAVRISGDSALLLEGDPQWAGAINTVLVTKGVRVDELRKQTTAGGLKPRSAHMNDDDEKGLITDG
jgi:hypothetical protein